MLGGMDTFQQGRYQRTPIGDMLPVYLDRAAEAWPTGAVRLNLAPEGWLQPWARLRENEIAEKSRIQSMPPFTSMRCRPANPHNVTQKIAKTTGRFIQKR